MSDGKSVPKGTTPTSPVVRSDLLAQGELEQLLLATQVDVTLLFDHDTTIHYASPSLTALMGYQPQDVVGKSFADFVHPDDIAAVAADWQNYLENTEDHDDPVQCRARRKDGSWGWFEAHAAVIKDDRFPGCSCVTLREVEHIYRLRTRVATAETMAKIGSWRWILKDGKPEWTASMYQMLGYPPAEGALDLDWAFNLIHQDDREEFSDRILRSLENPCSFTLTIRMIASDGKYRSVIHHCHTEKDASDNFVAMIGICQDVTAQAKAEHALRKSERAYRMLAEEASDVIFRVDVTGNCTFASLACLQTFGYYPEEMENTPILRYAERRYHAAILNAYELACQGLQAQRVTFKGRHRFGQAVWLEAGVRPISDPNGEVRELVIVARDITERRQYEEELREAREKAEAANIAKSKFLANMSHELRTPLNAVIGFSDIMQEEMFGPLGSDQYSDYVRLIHESGQFLLELINDILDMSKIEAGKYKLFLEEISLDEMIEGCLRIVETRAKERGVKLNWSASLDAPTISADERAVKQILLNLLSNAIKFSDKSGSVTIATEYLDGSVRVSVTDTGCGIPPDAIPRLAQPFEQVTSQANQMQNGTGLGLALVRSFVELHGGTLSMESVEGEGTVMTFTLPVEAPAQMKSA